MIALAPRTLAPVRAFDPLYTATYIVSEDEARAIEGLQTIDARDPDAPVYIYRSGKRLTAKVPLCEGCDARVIGVCWACNVPPPSVRRQLAKGWGA